IELSNQLAKQYASRFEHDVLEVIPEEKSSTEAGILIGYTDNYLKVQFEGSPDLIGSIVKVKLTKVGYPINDGVFVKVEDELIGNYYINGLKTSLLLTVLRACNILSINVFLILS